MKHMVRLCFDDAEGSRHERCRILYSRKCDGACERCEHVSTRADCIVAKDTAPKISIRKAVIEIDVERAGKHVETAKSRVEGPTWLKKEQKMRSFAFRR